MEFDKNLTNFEWTKLPASIRIPARAYHSAAYIPKLGIVAIVGGITCDKDGQCIRQNLNVLLIDTSNWSWIEHIISYDIFLSSTKVLLVEPTTLVYFGGYTSRDTSRKQEENQKSNYWGTITFHRRDCHSPLKVKWKGKSNKIGPFASADAIKIGQEILVGCGTQRQWGICTGITPRAKPCDLPQCAALAHADRWIRYIA